MATLIKKITDGSIVEFDKGTFDHWCVYLKRENEPRFAPKDILYFTELNKYGHTYGHKRIYDDFVKIYNHTNSVVSNDTLNMITEIANTYGADNINIEIWFTVIYGGMIAEENKENAILKKRVKRLGLHQLLIERELPGYATNYSKGKKWRELDVTMKSFGF